ncbi:hypothetical protein VNO78_07673 [Psophocarpus tetragonolobus]|uniref:Uncharacterized protein n=1 Tax=Psophocarpus tetragonolobus TaxID=3891 RepID=A0AAN9XRW4_PSOTE
MGLCNQFWKPNHVALMYKNIKGGVSLIYRSHTTCGGSMGSGVDDGRYVSLVSVEKGISLDSGRQKYGGAKRGRSLRMANNPHDNEHFICLGE